MYFTRPELLHAISDITVHEQIHGEDKFIEKALINFPKTIDDVKNYQDLEHGAVLHLSDIFRSIDYKIFKKLILSDGSKVNFNKLLTMSYLGDRYVPYDFTLPEEANFQRLKVIEFLQQEDILNIDQSKKCFAVDVEKLKSLLQNKKRVGGSFTRVRQYLALALKNLKGYEGVDVNTDIEQKDIKEILPIPEDVNEMMSRAYVKRCDDAMYKPWEFAPPIGNGWVRSVRLQSGEKNQQG
jgi:hypothetical protein